MQGMDITFLTVLPTLADCDYHLSEVEKAMTSSVRRVLHEAYLSCLINLVFFEAAYLHGEICLGTPSGDQGYKRTKRFKKRCNEGMGSSPS